MKYRFIIPLMLLLIAAAPWADDQRIVVGGISGLDPADSSAAYPVVVALSGGGARGLAAIGALKAFEEEHISVAAITGTSIGGVIGALYASGYTADQLAEIARDMDLTGLFSNQPSRSSMFLTQRQDRDRHLLSVRFDGLQPVIPRALTAGQRLTSMFTNLTTGASYRCGGDFDQLPIPFRTIATDIVSGQPVILGHGSLADAMRATLAFPLAFTPLERGDQLLMDGGMVMPIPVRLARGLVDTVDYAVAVNTTSPLLAKNEIDNPVDIANQVTTIMSAEKLNQSLREADCVIDPVPESITSTDFSLKDSLIELGYQAGKRAATRIKADMEQRKAARFMITSVEVSNCSTLPVDSLRARFEGLSFSRPTLIASLKQALTEFNLFSIEAELHNGRSDSATGLTLHLKIEHNWRADQITIEIVGNDVYRDSLLKDLLLGDYEILTTPTLRQGIEAIESRYREDGYDLARVHNVKYDPCRGVLFLGIDEATITDITVDNSGRTRDWLIRSSFPLSVGEPYSTRKASAGLANIYGTELFDRVAIDLEPYQSGARVRISVQERKYLQLRLGWHWDDRFQSEEFVEIMDDNLFGAGMEYLIHGRYANDRQTCFVRFATDRIFSTYLTTRLTGFFHRLERNLFDELGDIVDEREESRFGFEASLGQQIARLGTVSAGLRLEQVEYEYETGDTRENFGLRSIRLESLVENFDRSNFTTSGKKHLFELQFAGKYLGGEVEFTKFYSSVEAYWPIGSHLNYHPRLAIGLSRSNLPPSERFYLGGIHSFVGYRTNQLVGDKVISLSQEVRLQLSMRLYLTARYDLGQVYSSADHIKLSDIRHGFGLLAAFDTPIGPLEFGYGLATDDFDRYYLNVGLEF